MLLKADTEKSRQSDFFNTLSHDRTLALPRKEEHGLSTSLPESLTKIVAKVVCHMERLLIRWRHLRLFGMTRPWTTIQSSELAIKDLP